MENELSEFQINPGDRVHHRKWKYPESMLVKFVMMQKIESAHPIVQAYCTWRVELKMKRGQLSFTEGANFEVDELILNQENKDVGN